MLRGFVVILADGIDEFFGCEPMANLIVDQHSIASFIKLMLNKFRNDRGPAKYFHGRKEIIRMFERALAHHKHEKGGTTFLIQGAPGAGKTALLDRIARDAYGKWHIAHIEPDALWDTDWLMHALGRGDEYSISELTGTIALKAAKSDTKSVPVSKNPISVIQDWNVPLLLILDEAQTLGEANKPTGRDRSIASNILKRIHNGRMGVPVILLAAGLGTAETAFNTLGVSRFYGGCLVRLGGLREWSTRAIIQDWLMLDGMAKGDPTPWIDAIAEQVHGWPHHIMSYVAPAIEYLESNNGRMTAEGLKFVLASGNKFKLEYYDERTHDIDEDRREALARSIIDVPPGGTTTRPAILDSLKQDGLTQKEADVLFERALGQGVIDRRERGRYGIPIPSMRTWLVEEYTRGKPKRRDND